MPITELDGEMHIFRIQNKKIVIHINCNDCPYHERTLNMRHCKINKKYRKIKNKYFIDRPSRYDEINWFPNWCPLEDD